MTASDPDPAPRAGLAGSVMVGSAAASWGLWSVFVRPTGLPATVSTPIIFFCAGVVALTVALPGPRTVWTRTTVALLIANGLFDGLNVLAYFAALKVTTVAIAVLTHYFAPVLVALSAPWVDGVRARGTVPAACVALAGLVIVLEPWRAPADGALLGASFGLVSAVLYASSVFSARRLAVRIGAPRAMSYHALVAGVALAPLVIAHGAVTGRQFAIMAGGGAILGAAGGTVFTIGLMRIGSARAAVLTFLEPVVAVVVGVLVWGEQLRPAAMLGGVLVLGAGIQVARKAR
jgi:DME family drug/metabolite transporter